MNMYQVEAVLVCIIFLVVCFAIGGINYLVYKSLPKRAREWIKNIGEPKYEIVEED
jgi:hypothetical protein